MPSYEDFFLIVNGLPGRYTVEARGPGEISVPPQPFDAVPLTGVHDQVERILQGEAPSRQQMQAVGIALFDMLFSRKILRAFARAYTELAPGVNLRLKMVVRPPELSRLPWELLYDPEEEFFLAARLAYPVVRFVESGTPVTTLLAPRPLRVLSLQASPADLPPLDLQTSQAVLQQALGVQAEITTITATTPTALREILRQPFHVLHYDGHAFFSDEAGEGYLSLHDSSGNTHFVSGELLAAALDGTTFRLVVLAACQAGLDSTQKRFTGIAQQLMRSGGLPAVVAMQFAISNASAMAFIRGFYPAVVAGYPVDAAVVEGRKAILDEAGGDPFASPDWATPVVFMRSKEGIILSNDGDQTEQDRGRDLSPSPRSVLQTGAKQTQVRVGNISGISGGVINIAGGDISQHTVGSEQAGKSTTPIFERLYNGIEAQPDIPPAVKADLKAEMQELQDALSIKGGGSEDFLRRRLRAIRRLAPDIFQNLLTGLSQHSTGLGPEFRRVLAEMGEEQGE